MPVSKQVNFPSKLAAARARKVQARQVAVRHRAELRPVAQSRGCNARNQNRTFSLSIVAGPVFTSMWACMSMTGGRVGLFWLARNVDDDNRDSEKRTKTCHQCPHCVSRGAPDGDDVGWRLRRQNAESAVTAQGRTGYTGDVTLACAYDSAVYAKAAGG